jgi:hypothetical protein
MTEPSTNSGPAVPPPPAATRKRAWLLLALGAGLVLLLGLGITAYVVVARSNSDEEKIRRVIGDFAVAVDRQDQARVIALLCEEEADDIREDDDYDPANDGGVDPPAKTPVDVSDIRVNGDVASARISRPSRPDATLYFRREAGTWKVCAPAGNVRA